MGNGAKLGDNVKMLSETRHGEDSFVGDRAEVGSNTTIARACEVLTDAKVGADCELGAETLIERGAVVPDGTKLPAGSTVRAEAKKRNDQQKPVQPGGDPGVSAPARQGGGKPANAAARTQTQAR